MGCLLFCRGWCRCRRHFFFFCVRAWVSIHPRVVNFDVHCVNEIRGLMRIVVFNIWGVILFVLAMGTGVSWLARWFLSSCQLAIKRGA
ncbi:hypothetical protein BOTBODRAFT_349519 [Botryobasidium botryosum FD-172 SS1]|uniref:Transmembrane protein n=1 Tax=Botryobasidium botryosum (strain FD-172 SS1) TaxID=930990 RepID=A0A067MI32_BOTB1|nr:hypothetical protein BOTBODRAFT_349519 [Botryobasidium botryosum FD-172 SS1]